jgi:hypothetical protein
MSAGDTGMFAEAAKRIFSELPQVQWVMEELGLMHVRLTSGDTRSLFVTPRRTVRLFEVLPILRDGEAKPSLNS